MVKNKAVYVALALNPDGEHRQVGGRNDGVAADRGDIAAGPREIVSPSSRGGYRLAPGQHLGRQRVGSRLSPVAPPGVRRIEFRFLTSTA